MDAQQVSERLKQKELEIMWAEILLSSAAQKFPGKVNSSLHKIGLILAYLGPLWESGKMWLFQTDRSATQEKWAWKHDPFLTFFQPARMETVASTEVGSNSWDKSVGTMIPTSDCWGPGCAPSTSGLAEDGGRKQSVLRVYSVTLGNLSGSFGLQNKNLEVVVDKGPRYPVQSGLWSSKHSPALRIHSRAAALRPNPGHPYKTIAEEAESKSGFHQQIFREQLFW
jgi:hypothetical protein